MSDREWQRLDVGDRVRWCGTPPGASGVVLASSARSVLIGWDDGQLETFKVQHRWMLEPARRETERAS